MSPENAPEFLSEIKKQQNNETLQVVYAPGPKRFAIEIFFLLLC